MAKTILIFSDGTGQIGGLRPDQRLSNIYKMYRAMRPGSDSQIKPTEQVAFYDPGLGAGETNGWTFKRARNMLSAAVGTGIDENVIDCYEAIISHYQPGDKICLFGFSRGAYTVRALANVLNLCGVPTNGAGGGPMPRYGPKLRKIATDAVKYVYNHGAGAARDKYEAQREKKAERFRDKYGSIGTGADGEGQGNVQPVFIGVFDTVAALGSRSATLLVSLAFVVSSLITYWAYSHWTAFVVAIVPLLIAYWLGVILSEQFKYFFDDPQRKPRFWNPCDWPALCRHGHMAWWKGENYDRYVDREIRYLRHAMAIDEARAKFPRVGWARLEDLKWNNDRGNADWLEQVWFPGNHSDIGGSYPEDESRLSDIPLRWMMTQLKAAIPEIKVREDILVTWPDPLALQHDERELTLNRQPALLRWITCDKLTWITKERYVGETGKIDQSVIVRMKAKAVPQMGEVKEYRPSNLRSHPLTKEYFE